MIGRRSWRRGTPLVLVIAMLALAVSAASASAITVSGTVRCPTGAKVAGVWVQSSGGGSRFAERWVLPERSSVSGYKAAVNPGTIELHVGCGGDKTKWASDQWTPGISISASRKLNATCSGPAGTFAKRTCAFPARPLSTTRKTNPFPEGFCTWYAADRWKKATTQYPTWKGNAWEWDDAAKEQGWTVFRKAPAPRSIVVFEPGIYTNSSIGHVAWVESISYRSDGWYVNVKEMNSVGFGVESTRTLKHIPGMSYIWAPK